MLKHSKSNVIENYNLNFSFKSELKYYNQLRPSNALLMKNSGILSFVRCLMSSVNTWKINLKRIRSN